MAKREKKAQGVVEKVFFWSAGNLGVAEAVGCQQRKVCCNKHRGTVEELATIESTEEMFVQ